MKNQLEQQKISYTTIYHKLVAGSPIFITGMYVCTTIESVFRIRSKRDLIRNTGVNAGIFVCYPK